MKRSEKIIEKAGWALHWTGALLVWLGLITGLIACILLVYGAITGDMQNFLTYIMIAAGCLGAATILGVIASILGVTDE